MAQDISREVDVLIVGGATTGLYFGGLMAQQGMNVVICDCSSEGELGATFDIIHIAKEQFARFNLYEPQPGDDIYVSKFSHYIQKSALNNWPKNSYNETMVLRRVPLIRKLSEWARQQGAELLLRTRFEEPLFDASGKLRGGLFSCEDGSKLSIHARLVADASGIPAVVRTTLPDEYGVESFICGPRQQFFVILHYVDLKYPERDQVETTTTWTHYKIWLAPQHGSKGAIMGVGANLSFAYAEQVYQRFLQKGYLPEHTLTHTEQGSTPYCRTPYSFVADGFIALGSAACISNPWSGEGVPYSWLQCSIASEVCGEAMSNGAYPTQESLWSLNVRYQEEQGALFARNLAMLSGATSCTEEENDYEYKKGIIYENHTEDGASTERGSMVSKLIKGLLSRHISLKTLRELLAASSIGNRIEKHYRAYPSSPAGLPEWSVQAEALWSSAGSMADIAEADQKAVEHGC